MLKHNDLLVNFINSMAQIGKSAIYNGELGRNAIITTNLMRLQFNNLVIPKFISYYFQTKQYEDYIQSITKPAVNQASFTTKEFQKLKVPYFSIEEQTKIASFLSNVDEKISQLTQKHELLSQYKQGMMQKLFSQQVRFKADDGSEFGEWVLSELDPYIQESKDSSKIQDEYEVLTSSRRGLIRQAEYFEDSRLADRENIGFNIIQPNQITYRSRSDDGLFFFNLNELNITGIISTYYPVFTMKNGNNKFFYECLNFHKHKYIQYAVGTSQLVLSLNQLRKIKFRIPCIEEQTKIANFLSAIDEKIEVVAQQIEQAKHWKKACCSRCLCRGI
ncbi:restriction endonuclease subunit S [Acinetobacter haemolyticus]|nr:restriction endonuclease subunit S [Acinetobacter haemolyticus]